MNHTLFTVPRRAFAAIARHTRSNFQPILSCPSLPELQHPALSHPAEKDSIEHSLDLSFQQAIAISKLDRQIIDNLSRSKAAFLAR